MRPTSSGSGTDAVSTCCACGKISTAHRHAPRAVEHGEHGLVVDHRVGAGDEREERRAQAVDVLAHEALHPEDLEQEARGDGARPQRVAPERLAQLALLAELLDGEGQLVEHVRPGERAVDHADPPHEGQLHGRREARRHERVALEGVLVHERGRHGHGRAQRDAQAADRRAGVQRADARHDALQVVDDLAPRVDVAREPAREPGAAPVEQVDGAAALDEGLGQRPIPAHVAVQAVEHEDRELRSRAGIGADLEQLAVGRRHLERRELHALPPTARLSLQRDPRLEHVLPAQRVLLALLDGLEDHGLGLEQPTALRALALVVPAGFMTSSAGGSRRWLLRLPAYSMLRRDSDSSIAFSKARPCVSESWPCGSTWKTYSACSASASARKCASGTWAVSEADFTASSTCASLSFSPVMLVMPRPLRWNSISGASLWKPTTRTMSLRS
jgi:hypothetical protein